MVHHFFLVVPWGRCEIYNRVMGCRHPWTLLCFHASNIRTILASRQSRKATLSLSHIIIVVAIVFMHIKLNPVLNPPLSLYYIILLGIYSEMTIVLFIYSIPFFITANPICHLEASLFFYFLRERYNVYNKYEPTCICIVLFKNSGLT